MLNKLVSCEAFLCLTAPAFADRYISVDASDVDTAIDPTTGKNMTINRGNKVGKLPCD